jgi:hypothetical protein
LQARVARQHRDRLLSAAGEYTALIVPLEQRLVHRRQTLQTVEVDVASEKIISYQRVTASRLQLRASVRVSQPQEALAAAELEPDEESRLVARAPTYHALGRRGDADATLAAVTTRYGFRYPVEIAEIYAFRGEAERAFAALATAFDAGDPALLEIGSDS